jgi:hypothetical protein
MTARRDTRDFPHLFRFGHLHAAAMVGVFLTPVGALAQLSFMNIPDPPPLPASPVFVRLLLESPLPLVLTLAGVGVLLVAVANQRGNLRKGLRVGLPILGAALGVWLLAHFVRTDREKLSAAAFDLVRAVVAADVAATDRALADGAVLRTFVDENGLPKDRILERVGRDFRKGGSLEIKEYAILEMQATTQGERDGFVQFKIRAAPTTLGGLTFSWWRLDLARNAQGQWQTTGIDMIESSFGRR